MLRPISPLLAAAVFFCSMPALAQDVTGYDRFELWNDCGAMQLIVERLPTDATDIGLTREAIETSVRSRLRAARIYDIEAEPYLYVNVNVVGRAFSIGVYYSKVLFDTMTGGSGYAKTWDIGSAGTHGSDAGYITQFVSQHTDKFIDEYLRVNEKACKRK